MPPGRMVAALSVVLACAALITTLADRNWEVVWAALVFVISWIGALAIAAVLVVPVVVVRCLRGVRPLRPSARAWAVALAAGGVMVFPVNADFYTDPSLARHGSGVGACSGSVPLAEAVQNTATDLPYARISYLASCDD